jgi:hypothetical protein
MQSLSRFDGVWWSVSVPTGWIAQGEEKCATFRGTPPLGILQISSARKDVGPITDDDLREFAAEEVGTGESLMEVSYGSFSGFAAVLRRGDLIWRQWWLRSGTLMIYATYNVSQHKEADAVSEQEFVERILRSLERKN